MSVFSLYFAVMDKSKVELAKFLHVGYRPVIFSPVSIQSNNSGGGRCQEEKEEGANGEGGRCLLDSTFMGRLYLKILMCFPTSYKNQVFVCWFLVFFFLNCIDWCDNPGWSSGGS